MDRPVKTRNAMVVQERSRDPFASADPLVPLRRAAMAHRPARPMPMASAQGRPITRIEQPIIAQHAVINSPAPAVPTIIVERDSDSRITEACQITIVGVGCFAMGMLAAFGLKNI